MRRTRCIVAAILLLSAVAAEHCQPAEEIYTMLRAVGEDCVEEKEMDSFSNDELKEIFSGNCPTTENAKCIMTCIAEKSGLIKGNKFSFEQFMEAANKTLSCDQDMIKKAEEVARKCESEIATVEGDCNIGLQFCECIRKHR